MTAVRIPGQPLASLDGLSREDWLRLRKGGIGSSDAPAVAGVDPWRSPYAVWAEKVSTDWPDEDNAAMEWGRILEPVIARHFADVTGVDVRTPPAMYVHPERDWMRASPDRFTVNRDLNPNGVLEIKATGAKDAWADGPPNRVIVQVQHQLEALGLDEGWVAVLIGGNDYRHFHVPRDDELIGHLVTIEEDFWRRVIERDPPPVDGHESTTDALRALHEHVAVGVERILDAEAAAVRDELLRTKALIKSLEVDQAALENQLKSALGDAEVGVFAGEVLCTWKQQKPKDHVHNCPDCKHAPEGPPGRTFLPKKPKGDQ